MLVAGSGFNATETVTQTGDEAATLKVSQLGGSGYVPLKYSDYFSIFGGPTGAGAAVSARGPVVKFDGKYLASRSWAYIVLNPGGAQPCDKSLHYRAGKVSLPLQAATSALVVPPLHLIPSVGNNIPPPGLCLQWDSGAPFSLSGPYLSARFPPLRGVSSDVVFTEIPQTGDLGVATVTRTLRLDGGNTADFNIQTDPHPAVSTSSSWSWVIRDSQQVIQVAATNSSDIQHENNDAFYSGILFGVVGGALIALITELVVPLRRQHGRHGH